MKGELKLPAYVALVDHVEILTKLIRRQISAASNGLSDKLRRDHRCGIHCDMVLFDGVVIHAFDDSPQMDRRRGMSAISLAVNDSLNIQGVDVLQFLRSQLGVQIVF